MRGYAPEGGKRRYPAHFLSKLTDADGELQETFHWLSTSVSCGYLDSSTAAKMSAGLEQIGRKLGAMMRKHEKFCVR